MNERKTMYLTPTDPLNLIITAKVLKPKTSSGYDEISTKLLHRIIEEISIPFSHIVNLSFSTGIVPDKLKIAKIVPIFKSGTINDFNNYRPISLLPAFSKLLEKLVYNRIMSFITVNSLLNEHQFGFRKGHSTIQPVLHFLNHVGNSYNKTNPELTMGIFIDLKKAFDTVSHNILIQKLRHYGLRGVVGDWLKNYLSNRKQFVQYDNVTSNMQDIVSGVPQGSILGPLLFLLYINDIPNAMSSNRAKIKLFADDTTIYLSHENVNILYNEANAVVKNIFNWLCSNKLTLNTTKTKYIIICPRQRSYNDLNLKLTINGQNIQKVGKDETEKTIKFLGIYIDDQLTWKDHLLYINKTISKSTFILNRVKNILPVYTLRTLYYALIHPILNYGILAWGNAVHNDNNKTFVLQKKSVRIINRSAYNSHTDPLFKSSGILKLRDMYEQQAILFMFDYETKRLPKSFDNLFVHNFEIQNNIITRHSNDIYIYKPKTNFVANLPYFMIPVIWNKLRNNIDLSKSKETTKSKIKQLMLCTYNDDVRCENPFCNQCQRR